MDNMSSLDNLLDCVHNSHYWQYITFIPTNDGIKIIFDKNIPIHISQKIKKDIETGKYPGIRIKDVYDRYNVFNIYIIVEKVIE